MVADSGPSFWKVWSKWNTSTHIIIFGIFAVAKKGWPAALGTDEGVRPPTGIWEPYFFAFVGRIWRKLPKNKVCGCGSVWQDLLYAPPPRRGGGCHTLPRVIIPQPATIVRVNFV